MDSTAQASGTYSSLKDPHHAGVAVDRLLRICEVVREIAFLIEVVLILAKCVFV